MNNRQSYALQAYRRAQGFVGTNAASLGTIPQSLPKQNLDAIVANLSGYATAQGTAIRQRGGATTHQAALRVALVINHMRPIAEIAKDNIETVPEASALTMPPQRLNVERLVASAKSMAEAATPYAQTFIANGLPSDFIAQLLAASAALTAQVNVKGMSQGSQAQATTGVVAELERGRRTINILNAMIVSALVGNDPLLAAWNNAKRITPQPDSGGAANPAPVTSVTPVAPVPPAAATVGVALNSNAVAIASSQEVHAA